MATLSTRTIAQNCLGLSGDIALRQDIFGVYANDNPQTRSLNARLDLIQNEPFVRVALVTIQGSSTANLQRDLDNANQVYQNECDTWVYCVGSITVNDASLLILNQDDCLASGHSVSDEEDDLFDLGRNLGADVVGYYVNGSSFGTNTSGCAAHPPGRRGFWVNQNAAAYSQWTFAHELTHVVGDNAHVTNTDNLMMGSGTVNITNPPPDLTNSQCNDIVADPDMETC